MRRRGGVAFLCLPRQLEHKWVWQKDAGGRLVSPLLKYNNCRINLVNIYAPSYSMKRGIFFQSLAPYFFPNSPLILAGGFNNHHNYCYDGPLYKMGGSASIDACLTDLKATNLLWDAWCLKHPRDHQFTWFNSDRLLASRLDSLLISRYLCAQVISCKIHPCVYFDPDFVYIKFNLHTADRRGPGVCEFNNSLLQDG